MNYSPRPLLPGEQKEFQENLLSIEGEAQAARRDISKMWKWFGIGGLVFGAVFGLSGVYAHQMLLPHIKYRVLNHYFSVDQTTGFIAEVPGAADAPKLFGPRVREGAIEKYASLYLEYEPGSDQKHFSQVQALSSSDQAARYVAWHNASPHEGSVEVEHFSYTPHGSSIVKGVETFEYTMHFKRIRTLKGVVGRPEDRIATIQFHFDPKLIQTEDQSHDNPLGMVVTYFKEDE